MLKEIMTTTNGNLKGMYTLVAYENNTGVQLTYSQYATVNYTNPAPDNFKLLYAVIKLKSNSNNENNGTTITTTRLNGWQGDKQQFLCGSNGLSAVGKVGIDLYNGSAQFYLYTDEIVKVCKIILVGYLE